VKSRDEEGSLESAPKRGRILTVEEQTVLGTVGRAVAEVSGRIAPTELDHVGLTDCFAESGPHLELLAKYNISLGAIISLERRVVRGVSA